MNASRDSNKCHVMHFRCDYFDLALREYSTVLSTRVLDNPAAHCGLVIRDIKSVKEIIFVARHIQYTI